ncbi:unnamed protein product [Polarella glacialis]|uniref:C3H1-type domain-containing protein n=1 Tax=Polarella glacialis TaxID=89957 RepID=A0A813I1F2_POLGL|nr:unnamed protein product [Polarella glacialis]
MAARGAELDSDTELPFFFALHIDPLEPHRRFHGDILFGTNFLKQSLDGCLQGVSDRMSPGTTLDSHNVAKCLHEIGKLGYRLQSVCRGDRIAYNNTGSSTFYFQLGNGAEEAEELRTQLRALRSRLEAEAEAWSEEKLAQQQKCRQLGAQVLELHAQCQAEREDRLRERGVKDAELNGMRREAATQATSVAGLHAGLAAAATRQAEELAALRTEFETTNAEVETTKATWFAEMQQKIEQLEAGHVQAIAAYDGRVADAIAEKTALQAQLEAAQSFAPALVERTVPARDGRLGEKHIRIACPGVDADDVTIEPIPNGVQVEFRSADNEPIYKRSFQYPHSDGRFELCIEECCLDWGVLVLVLKQLQQAKLKLARGRASPLVPIDEGLEVVPAAHEGLQNFSLSRTPSQDSLTTNSSEWIFASVDGRSDKTAPKGASSVELPAEQPTGPCEQPLDLSEVRMTASSPAATSRQCLLLGSLLLAGDGSALAVEDLAKGVELRSFRATSDGWIFGVAVVRATRVEKARDQDIAELCLEGLDGQAGGQLRATISHSLLATVANSTGGWPLQFAAVEAGEFKTESHQLFTICLDESGGLTTEGCPEVKAVSKSVQSCQVVEIELTDAADAVLVQVADGVFAAVFGSPGWQSMEVVTKNHSLHVQLDCSDLLAGARSSMSDPTHSQRTEPLVYRKIISPHDGHCTAWCKFHFTKQGCKRGLLCPLCHHADHADAAKCTQSHRGKRR